MKSKNFLRLASLNLSLALLTGTLSCGSETVGNETDTTDSVTTEETTAVETDRSELVDNLPTADYNGYEFRIIGRNDNFVYASELGSDTLNGEVVNDAAYTRNRNVEERYNIKIVTEAGKPGDINAKVRQSTLAGDDAYDLIFNSAFSVPTLAMENLLIDWYDIDAVDFANPWWSKNAIDNLSIVGHSFFAIGDMNVSNIGIVMCIFYNKVLGEEYKLGNLYEVVNSGKWTYDYFNDMVKNIYRDVNGNSERDAEDVYGFGNNIGSTLQPMVFAMGARFSTNDENELPVISMNNEKFIGVFEKLYALHMENNGVWADADFQVPRTMFANNQIVFNTGAVYHSATLYRDMKQDFGVLPFPKADEAMDTYYTCHDPNVTLAAVPMTVSDLERTGTIIEALGAESYRVMTPAFYETALKVKYSRDDESVQTLDLIMKGVTFDFIILYGTTGHYELSQCMKNLMAEKSRDFASYYAKYYPAQKEYYDAIIEQYQKLN